MQERVADTMEVQHYDIRRPIEEGGGFEVRYWSPVNSPVIDGDGELLCIIHEVEDVTDRIRAEKVLESARVREEVFEEQERIANALRDLRDPAPVRQRVVPGRRAEHESSPGLASEIAGVIEDIDAMIAEIRSKVFERSRSRDPPSA